MRAPADHGPRAGRWPDRHHRRPPAGCRDLGGKPVPLPEQDRSRWDRDRLTRDVELVQTTFARGIAGPYLLQTAIASVHAEAVSYDATDWRRIVAYYDLASEPGAYHPWHATRAEALLRLGDTTASADAFRRAIEGCDNDAVADHLRPRLAQVSA